MPYERIGRAQRRAIGSKQTIKAAMRDQVVELFVADDADQHVIAPLLTLGLEKQIPVTVVESMQALGRACGINVGAASAAILKEGGAEHANH